MSWELSQFRAGEVVEIRSKEEILASLDERGCLDGLPFMPEMLQHCGRRFRLGAVAHKTCETANRTWKGRRVERAVHLAGVRCDGSAHGGCQADCNLFWKDAWLKRPADPHRGSGRPGGCTEADLVAGTRVSSDAGEPQPRYSCQATRITEASTPLPWWDPRQYARDVLTGNHRLRDALTVLWLATLKHTLAWTPRGYRLVEAFRASMHRRLTGREVPDFEGRVPPNAQTPTGRLDLKPGERIRIKSQQEIEETLDSAGKNRGLSWGVELARYCGQEAIVRRSVTRILDEQTGQMLDMKQPCIVLEGVVCTGQESPNRLLCPRAIAPFWREIWLERIVDARPGDVRVCGQPGRAGLLAEPECRGAVTASATVVNREPGLR
jgi:hypothetical protein